jgi:ribosomal protein S8
LEKFFYKKVLWIVSGNIKKIKKKKKLQKKFKERKKPHITTLRCIKKPGLRIYSNHKEIPKVLNGIRIAILSNSQGIVTNWEARQKQIREKKIMLCMVIHQILFKPFCVGESS